MATDERFDQRRAWLDELLAKRHLWPNQVAIVRILAEELGVEIRIFEMDLNAPADGWREVATR